MFVCRTAFEMHTVSVRRFSVWLYLITIESVEYRYCSFRSTNSHCLLVLSSFYGENNLKEAFTCHLISRAYTYQGDFRSALDYEKRRFSIYKERLGPDSDYTRDSDDCLHHLTQQAVTRARRMAELAFSGLNGTLKGSGDTNQNPGKHSTKAQTETDSNLVGSNMAFKSILPSPLASYGVGIPVPTVASILETLNRVNGILVIQLRLVVNAISLFVASILFSSRINLRSS